MTPYSSASSTVIRLRERNLNMLTQDLTMRNPLRLLSELKDGLMEAGDFGAVLSRSGGGKTALTVQIAMNALLQGKNVLHISLTDPVEKVTLWYDEVLSQMAQQYNESRIGQLWDELLPHRLIMTFRAHSFSVEGLEERLQDFAEQKIFVPEILVVDGFDFEKDCRGLLEQLKEFSLKRGLHTWLTVTTHRHESPADSGYPVQVESLGDLFKIILLLKSGDGPVNINVLKHPEETGSPDNLTLDPNTLLIQNSTD